ncbi:MAG: efflux RND transporter periplasmic adaptor subunit [Allomuricauda sp.]
MKTRIIIIGAIVAIIVSIALKLNANKKEVAENVYRPDLKKAVLVKTAKVNQKTLNKTFTYTGTFVPLREVMIVPQVKGQIKQLYFEEGDVVKKGQPLVLVDDDILQAQYVAAEANYTISKRNLERNETAATSGGVSNIQLDNYRLGLKNAESELKQLKKQIEWSHMTAPFTGTITLRDAEIGMIVDNKALARITDLSKLKLEIVVPEKEIVLFSEGDEVAVQTDIYPSQELEANIDYISNRADDSHNYTVKIVIEGSSAPLLKSGMYGTVLIGSESSGEMAVIPRAALLGSAKNPQAIVVKNGKAVIRDIKIGGSNAEDIVVVEGLQPGETVVTSGHINLSNGSNVEISN